MNCAGEVDLNIPDNAVSIIYGKKENKKRQTMKMAM
jgi:hypothetical protein